MKRPVTRVRIAGLAVACAIVFGAVTASALIGDGNVATAESQQAQDYTTMCRDAAGAVIQCPPCPLTTTGNYPRCDIDSQPRIDLSPKLGCKVNDRLDAGADERYEAGCEPYAYGVVAAAGLTLTLISQTATTLTLGWTPPTGAAGYRFTRSGQAARSHTWDGARNRVTFAKGAATYKVEELKIGLSGDYAP